MFGNASFGPDDTVAAAAVSLRGASYAKGQQLLPLKAEAHTGCAFNELADAVAKSAALGGATPALNFLPTVFWQGISEGVIDWAWTCHGQANSAHVPPLGADGTWSAAACQTQPVTLPPSPYFAPEAVAESMAQELYMSLVQYNCLSIKGQAAKEIMATALDQIGCGVAGLQETRTADDGISAPGSYWVLSSPATSEGVGGCQIWLHREKPMGYSASSGEPFYWERRSFSILLAEPQLLIVLAHAGGVRFCLVSGHAPTALATERIRTAWWRKLSQGIRTAPRGCIPLVFVDANARFEANREAPATTCSPPRCHNARAMLALAKEFNLEATHQFSHTGKRLFSWKSPQGRLGLIDYILFDACFATALRTDDTPDLQDLHSGVDHYPVAATLRVRVDGTKREHGPRICNRAIKTQYGQSVLRRALLTAPVPGWEVDATSHVEAIHVHLRTFVAQHLPPAPATPRHPALTAATLEEVRRRRLQRQRLRALSNQERKAFLLCVFRAWRNQRPPLNQFLRISAQVADNVVELHRLNKKVTACFQADKAQFLREQTAQARASGPAAFAHMVRAVTRQGRRFKTPHVVPMLHTTEGPAIGATQVMQQLGKHFAKPERARPVSEHTLRQSATTVEPLETVVDAHACPTLADLVRGFKSLQSGRASGRSGLPAEVYQADPFRAGALFLPVAMKIAARGMNPLQWCGGNVHSIPKPNKDSSTLGGWRSILLLESDAKAYQKAQTHRPPGAHAHCWASWGPSQTHALAAISASEGAPPVAASQRAQRRCPFPRLQGRLLLRGARPLG